MEKANTPKKSLARRCAARLKRPPRLSGWFSVSIALAVLVWSIAPQQLPVSLYKLSLVTLAGVVGYWLDRGMFPYARPDEFLPETDRALDLPEGETVCTLLVAPDADQLRLAGTAMMRRAIIVAATMLTMGLGA